MRFIEFFLRHAKLNYSLSLFFLLAGIYCYQVLPRELFPPLDSDKILITGVYAGASADNLDKMAVGEIEDEVRSISSVTKIESTIRPGMFTIVITLKEGSDKNNDLSKVKDAISLARANLPSDMDEPTATVLERKIPLMQVSIASETLSMEELLKKAKVIKKEFAAIPNLSDVALYGESDKEIQIRLDSKKIRAYGLNPQEVSSAMTGLSYIFPLGKIESQEGHFYLSTIYGKKEPTDLLETFIKIGDKRLRLRDFASVEYGYGESSTLSSFNGQKAFTINISKDEKGDAIALSKLLHHKIDRLRELHPEIAIDSFSDTSVYIKSRLNTVVSNITLGFLLVSLSMYWLINKRISLVVAMGIPFSFLLGAMFFYLLGNTINMISLLGALIAVGILVDDAIIVSENIQRHIEEGMKPKKAAVEGVKEVIAPVLVASATTIFAFLPMLLMSGEVGKFIKMIPLAVAILLLASLIESFLFLPLHSAHILSKKEPTRSWTRANLLYHDSLAFLFARKKLVLGIFLLLIPILIFLGFKHSKYQLFPEFDGTEVYISGRLSANHTVEETQALIKELEREILEHKGEFFIKSTSAVSGWMMDASGESETASNVFIIFAELEEAIEDNFVERYITPILSFDWDDSAKIRPLKSFEIEKMLQEHLQGFKKAYALEELRVAAPKAGIVKHDIEISLIGPEALLKQALPHLTQVIEQTHGVKSVYNDMKAGISEIKLAINPYGESLGLNEGVLSALLSDYFLFAKKGKSLDEEGVVHLRIEDIYKDELSTLRYFSLQLGSQKVLLEEVVDFHTQEAPEKIIKEDGDRQRTVYADVIPEELTAMELLKKLEPEIKKIKESGLILKLGGERVKRFLK